MLAAMTLPLFYSQIERCQLDSQATIVIVKIVRTSSLSFLFLGFISMRAFKLDFKASLSVFNRFVFQV